MEEWYQEVLAWLRKDDIGRGWKGGHLKKKRDKKVNIERGGVSFGAERKRRGGRFVVDDVFLRREHTDAPALSFNCW